jgi:hypothetical protein
MAKSGKLNKRQIELIVFIAVILGELVFCGVLIFGIMTGRTGEKVQDLQSKVEEGRALMDREVFIRKTFLSGYEALEKLGDYVPKGSDPYAWTYEYIVMRARDVGIALDDVSQVDSGSMAIDDSSKYRVHVSTSCSYDKIKEFMTRLEEGNPLLQVVSLEINNTANPLSHTAEMVLQWPLGFSIEEGK